MQNVEVLVFDSYETTAFTLLNLYNLEHSLIL